MPVDVRVVRTARRLRLRYDDRRHILKLTCPPRTKLASALAWAAEQRLWVETQIASSLPTEPLAPGACIPLEGKELQLVWDQAMPRTVRARDGMLCCGGPREGFERRIERYLKALALDALSRDTAEFAAKAGLTPRSVSVGDADTRWGSCSSAGRIRYSWRLILAPPEVRRYVAAHEVAHLRHLDHSPEFRTFEKQLFGGDVQTARDLLRRLGPRLKRVGRH